MMAQFKEKKCRTALQETTNQQAGAPAASQDGNPSPPRPSGGSPVLTGDARAQVNGDVGA